MASEPTWRSSWVRHVESDSPPSGNREALRYQIHDRRRYIDLAVEPRFHHMLVARLHVGQVVSLKRAHVRRHNIAKHPLVLIHLAVESAVPMTKPDARSGDLRRV